MAHRPQPGPGMPVPPASPRRRVGVAAHLENAVYDMYPWNQPGTAQPRGRDGSDDASARQAAVPASQAARALQVALDRRDNGGESPAVAGQ
jgi:hypothetical protein